MKLEGLYTAIITPFDPNGKVDKEGLKRNLRYQLQHNAQGVVVLGTTGESPTLTHQEKREIIEIALEEVKGKTTLMIGTGSYSTAQTIEATKEAQEMGADAALIICPYYNKPTQEGLFRHFSTICEAVTLPICIYNNSGRTGQNLQTETLKRLASIPTIVGVKEASGSIAQMQEVIESIVLHRPDFRILCGDDLLTLPLMALGGHGIISVMSNLVPGLIQAMVQAAQVGDFAKARQWHYQLSPLFNTAFIETYPIPIKAAMQLCGMAAGPCRLPLCDLAPNHFEKLREVVAQLPTSWLGEYGQT